MLAVPYIQLSKYHKRHRERALHLPLLGGGFGRDDYSIFFKKIWSLFFAAAKHSTTLWCLIFSASAICRTVSPSTQYKALGRGQAAVQALHEHPAQLLTLLLFLVLHHGVLRGLNGDGLFGQSMQRTGMVVVDMAGLFGVMVILVRPCFPPLKFLQAGKVSLRDGRSLPGGVLYTMASEAILFRA